MIFAREKNKLILGSSLNDVRSMRFDSDDATKPGRPSPSDNIKNIFGNILPSAVKTNELERKYDYLNDRLETQLSQIDNRLDETRDLAMVRLNTAWSNWSDWSRCSVTCNIGHMTRHRHCNGLLRCKGSGQGNKYPSYEL